MVDTFDFGRIDMIGEYQPLIVNTFVIKMMAPINRPLCSHGRVVSLLIVVWCFVVSSVLWLAVDV